MEESYGKTISRLRRQKGLTQKELADEMHMTVQTISNWENSLRVPKLTPRQTLALCQALGCSLEELANSGS